MIALGFTLALLTPQNVPETVENRWLFATVQELTRCGLWLYPLSAETRRPPTRYEIVVSMNGNLSRMEEVLTQIGIQARKDPKSTFYLPRDVAFVRLGRMLDIFRKEFDVIEARVPALRQQVSRVRRQASRLRSLYPKSEIGLSQKFFPQIPENHEYYDALEQLGKHRLVREEEFPRKGRMGPSPCTGPEFARLVSLAVPRLAMFLKTTPKSADPDELDFVFTVHRMCDIFSPELEAAGVNLKELGRQASRAARIASDRMSGSG